MRVRTGGALIACALFICLPARATDYGDPSVTRVQQWALQTAGLEAARLHDRWQRARWAAALPQLRVRVAHQIDQDGRATVRIADGRIFGDLTGVDTRADDLRIQGDLIWSLRALVEGPDEVATLREMRSASSARLALLEVVVRTYFERRRAQAARDSAQDDATRREAELSEAACVALLDGLTDGRFSRELVR